MHFTYTEKLLSRALMAGAFPSAAAAAGNRNQVLFQSIKGDAAIWPVRRSSSADTLYDMASLTKMMATTLVAMKFIGCGKLQLEGSISDYCDAPRDKAKITIRDLLCHTGGFPAHFLLRDCQAPPEAAADLILRRPLDCNPGTRVIYSCMGFILLGRILETISGRPLDQLARTMIFEPLNMLRTGYLTAELPMQRPVSQLTAATEYDPVSQQYLCGVVHDENARFLRGVSGNAGVFAPLADCIKLASCFLNQGRGLLNPELFSMMTSNWTEGLNENRGLGVAVWKEGKSWSGGPALQEGSFGHTGFTGTSLYISPYHDLYFILLTNRVHFGRALNIMPDYRTLFHQAVIDDWQREKPHQV